MLEAQWHGALRRMVKEAIRFAEICQPDVAAAAAAVAAAAAATTAATTAAATTAATIGNEWLVKPQSVAALGTAVDPARV